jgi:hypothetical protein
LRIRLQQRSPLRRRRRQAAARKGFLRKHYSATPQSTLVYKSTQINLYYREGLRELLPFRQHTHLKIDHVACSSGGAAAGASVEQGCDGGVAAGARVVAWGECVGGFDLYVSAKSK